MRQESPAKAAGLNTESLAEFKKSLKKETGVLNSLAGAAHIVLHKGKCVFTCAGGVAKKGSPSPFSLRTLCKLHGATKPLVGCAFLTLVDAGKCKLSDPVAKYLPFPDRYVKASATKSSKLKMSKKTKRKSSKSATSTARVTVPATLSDLLTNTAGLPDIENPKETTQILGLIRRGKVTDLSGLCETLASKPLNYCPKKTYSYSYSIDILGRVCEIISGKPLDKFMQEAFLKPMEMRDTHWHVPAQKRSRMAALYMSEKIPKRQRLGNGAEYKLVEYHHRDAAPGILSGSGGITSYNDAGLWSTAQDYAKFCQMILTGGKTPSGQQILKPSTVKAMWRDALWYGGGRDGRVPGWHDSDGPQKGGWWDYRGLSMIHTFLDLDKPPTTSKGKPRRTNDMWFSGGGGAYWSIDAKRKLITVSFTQTMGGREDENDGHGPVTCRIKSYI